MDKKSEGIIRTDAKTILALVNAAWIPLKEDYLVCKTCDNELFDWFHYADIKDTAHGGPECVLREPTDEEYAEALLDCAEDGCLE